LLTRARATDRFQEIAQILRDIHIRLQWIPLDFGEPLKDFGYFAIEEHIGVVAPLVVKYGVDEFRHIVYVVSPFTTSPKSGLDR
jgi:hypothetical protein